MIRLAVMNTRQATLARFDSFFMFWGFGLIPMGFRLYNCMTKSRINCGECKLDKARKMGVEF